VLGNESPLRHGNSFGRLVVVPQQSCWRGLVTGSVIRRMEQAVARDIETSKSWLVPLIPSLQRHAWLWGCYLSPILFRSKVDLPPGFYGDASAFVPWDVVASAYATDGLNLFEDSICADLDSRSKRLVPLPSCGSLASGIMPLLVPTQLKTEDFHTSLTKRLAGLKRYDKPILPIPKGLQILATVFCWMLLFGCVCARCFCKHDARGSNNKQKRL